MSDNTITSDGQGVLVGVTPAQPQNTTTWAQQSRPDQAVSQPLTVTDQSLQQPNGRFTEQDIERARQQEKEKLYPRIEEMNAQLKELREAREAEMAERQRLAEEAEAARQAKEESEMDLRALFEKRETEFNNQISELSKRYDTDRAIFERERALQEAQQYRLARIEQESEYLLPELRDLVGGDTPEAVDASIEEMKQRSEAIFNNIAAAQQPQPFRGAAMASVPPVGPMEQMPSYEQLSPDDIRGMDMDTYKRYREQLLRATSPQRQRGR
jgi:chromosome segregation ATPase